MNRSLKINLIPFLRGTALKRGAIFGSILFAALLAFEIFNFSTTQFALLDILGDLKFAGIRWATVLAIAFCGIDFAGIARIFTPEQGRDEPAEVWYLFGAWILAAGFNATLTWWGVSVAILNHNAAGGALLGQVTMTKVVPVMVAVMVWMVRLLIIGTFSVAGERLFTSDNARPVQRTSYQQQPQRVPSRANDSVPASSYLRPAPKPAPAPTPAYASNQPRPAIRPEPTYHPIGMNAQGGGEKNSLRS
jgi:hypothetical protein